MLSQSSFPSLISLFYGSHSQSCFAFVLSPATLCFGSIVGSVHHSVFVPLSVSPPPHPLWLLYCSRPSHSSRERHHLKSFYRTTYFHVSLASWSVLTSLDLLWLKPPSMFTVLLHLSCSEKCYSKAVHAHIHWKSKHEGHQLTASGNAFFVHKL